MKDNVRIWVLGSVIAIGALLAGGWFLGVQPALANAAQSSQAATAANAQVQALKVSLANLTKQSASLDTLKAAAAKSSAAVPTTLDAQSFIDRVSAVAAADGVTVNAITPGAAQAYTQPASTVVAPTPTASATPSASPSATTAAAPIATVKPEAATDSRITAANLVVIPVTIVVHGSSANALQFSSDIRADTRLFLINGYNVSAGSGSSGVVATLTGYIYSLKS